MKSHAQPATWTNRGWSGDNIAVDSREDWENSSEYMSEMYRSNPSRSLSGSMRIVGVLAFCQAILFLVLFLFLCARAGAATESKSNPSLELEHSTYTTQTVRDPFGSEVSKPGDTAGSRGVQSVGANDFNLGGILYDAANPAALVNDQLVELNKPTKVRVGQGEVEVKAVTITRDLVVLEVGGQKVELQFGGGERNSKKDSK
jgi:hypothetical protein